MEEDRSFQYINPAGGIGFRYQANESDVDELVSDLKHAYS